MPLDYPSDFNTPAFPAGKSVALSRLMGIASCVTFLLVIFLCGILIWAVRSQRIDPFIVEIDKLTGQWTVVGHSHGNGPIEYSAKMALQESVLGNFTANWFSVSGDAQVNDAMWQTCERDVDCGTASPYSFSDKTCNLYCVSGEELFSHFIYDVVPLYQERVALGEEWVVDKNQIYMEPVGNVFDVGGTWRVTATIKSNLAGEISVIAFAKIARNTEKYPQTMGYYVADFNAYKISE